MVSREEARVNVPECRHHRTMGEDRQPPSHKPGCLHGDFSRGSASALTDLDPPSFHLETWLSAFHPSSLCPPLQNYMVVRLPLLTLLP
jgi:hypothetical protein